MKIENILVYLNYINFNFLSYKIYFKIFNRNIKIKFFFKNFKLAVHNGKFFIPIRITSDKINNKGNTMLGSFSFSKAILIKNFDKKRRKKKKRRK